MIKIFVQKEIFDKKLRKLANKLFVVLSKNVHVKIVNEKLKNCMQLKEKAKSRILI